MEAVTVIATHNEAESIGDIVTQLVANEIDAIVVDDSSPDGTSHIAAGAGARVITRLDVRGIATAYHLGLTKALELGYEWIIQMDAGGTHKPKDANAMLTAATSYNVDLLIGSRFWQGNYPILGLRTLISRVAACAMMEVGSFVQDATSGFRVWHRGLLAKVVEAPFRAKGFAFQMEALYRAYHAPGFHQIDEWPIEYKLTNSSFKPWMLIEALKVWGGLYGDYLRNHS